MVRELEAALEAERTAAAAAQDTLRALQVKPDPNLDP
jgi:hypothetical protein